jgi:hypothetical protein
MINDPPTVRPVVSFEPSARIGAVVLGSRSSAGAAAWYRQALELPRRDDALDAGGVLLRITQRLDVAPTAVEPMRLIANFALDDILAVEARLIAMETIWVRELERTPWGIVGTVLDPDGNYVQIIEAPRDGECGSAPRRSHRGRSRVQNRRAHNGRSDPHD